MARSPWDAAEFFPTKPSTKNAYSSLNFFEDHLQEGEEARAVFLGREGALILTAHRLLELRPHLDDFGFWNVKSFEGYEETLALPLTGATMLTQEGAEGAVDLTLSTRDGPRSTSLVPHGPLTREHIDRFLRLLEGAIAASED